MRVNGTHYRTVWLENTTVKMIDQALLPHRFEILSLPNHTDTAKAIKDMRVRGAGAIGATAGYAMAQAALGAPGNNFFSYLQTAKKLIENTRPTAQNLFYATNRVFSSTKNLPPLQARKEAVKAAQAIADEDAENCRLIGMHGSKLIKNNSRIQTHCNAGWLAFVDYGSALSPIYQAAREGREVFVYVDETRPRGQGASLTAWELANENINHAIIADNAAGYLMQQGRVDMAIVGADRICANGDVANKIGTYEKALCANENGIPFYVAAPTTTIDFSCPSGKDVPIEERSGDEILYVSGLDSRGSISRVLIAPKGSNAVNLAFDLTPSRFITGIITEKGIFRPVEIKKLKKIKK